VATTLSLHNTRPTAPFQPRHSQYQITALFVLQVSESVCDSDQEKEKGLKRHKNMTHANN